MTQNAPFDWVQNLHDGKKKEIKVLLLLWPNNYCSSKISFSHAMIVLYWQGHGCCIPMVLSARSKVERKQTDDDRIWIVHVQLKLTTQRSVIVDLIMTRWPFDQGYGKTWTHARVWQMQGGNEMLGEYQVIPFQCGAECHLSWQAWLHSTNTTRQTDWTDYAADYVNRQRDKQQW